MPSPVSVSESRLMRPLSRAALSPARSPAWASRAKRSVASDSWPKALTTRIWRRVSVANPAASPSRRRCLRVTSRNFRDDRWTPMASSGTGVSASTASSGSRSTRRIAAPTTVVPRTSRLIQEVTKRSRTRLTSPVSRMMRSPVRADWWNGRASRCRCSNSRRRTRLVTLRPTSATVTVSLKSAKPMSTGMAAVVAAAMTSVAPVGSPSHPSLPGLSTRSNTTLIGHGRTSSRAEREKASSTAVRRRRRWSASAGRSTRTTRRNSYQIDVAHLGDAQPHAARLSTRGATSASQRAATESHESSVSTRGRPARPIARACAGSASSSATPVVRLSTSSGSARRPEPATSAGRSPSAVVTTGRPAARYSTTFSGQK